MPKVNQILTRWMKSNLVMLSFFIFVSMSICFVFRYEVIADINNYHYYIAWAFFKGRTFQDIAVGVENSYLNPLIEIPAYLLIEHFNDTPIVYQLYHSLYWGMLAFVAYLLVKANFSVDTVKGKVQTFFTMLFILTGFGFLVQNGTSSNEIPVILCVMVGLYLIYKELFILKQERWQIFAFSGVLMGAALGLKLTIIVWCLALGLTLICFWKKLKTPFKTIGIFALTGFIGFLLTYGWWGWILFKEMGSPMYPYMNNIFHSPYYPQNFLTYNEFFEKNWWNWLIFPFLASFQGRERVTSEAEMFDARLALGWLMLLGLGLLLCHKKGRKYVKITQPTLFLIIFAVIGYFIWFYVFSIIRYAIPVEMIISLMLVKVLSYFWPKKKLYKWLYGGVCVLLTILLLWGLPYKSWGNMRNMQKVVDIEEVSLPKNAIVSSISGNVGISMAKIAEQNPDVKLINEAAEFTTKGNILFDKIQELKKESDYRIYIVLLKTFLNEFDRNTPIYDVTRFLDSEGAKTVFNNLQFVIKTELGVDNFYCRNVIKEASFYKNFVCIDKRDKDKIFTNAKKNRPVSDFRRNLKKSQPLAFPIKTN